MNKGGAPRHDPIPIGDISTPPFARLPEPSTLFRHRAERFAAVALQREVAPYLKFLGDVCRIQDRIQAGLPVPAIPPADMLERSRQFGMPLLHGGGLLSDGPFLAILDRLIAMLAEIDMPQTALSVLEGLAIPDGATRDAMVQAVLGN